jgi:hypothetical protein
MVRDTLDRIAPGLAGAIAPDRRGGYLVIVTVNGSENVSGEPHASYASAEAEAHRVKLGSTSHLRSYRLEVVENFGDRSRFAIHDKKWESMP